MIFSCRDFIVRMRKKRKRIYLRIKGKFSIKIKEDSFRIRIIEEIKSVKKDQWSTRKLKRIKLPLKCMEAKKLSKSLMKNGSKCSNKELSKVNKMEEMSMFQKNDLILKMWSKIMKELPKNNVKRHLQMKI